MERFNIQLSAKAYLSRIYSFPNLAHLQANQKVNENRGY